MSGKRRAPMTVNPVTGELREARVEKGKHTTGCIKVDEKYLHAARDAGLGSDQGMYSHLSVLRKAGVDVLRPSDIDNAGPGDMGGGYAHSTETSGSKYLFSTGHGARAGSDSKRSSLRERVTGKKGGRNNNKSASGLPPKRGGIRQVVQGRSRAISSKGSGGGSGDSSRFQKQKGVVTTMGGAHDIRRQHKQTPARLGGGGSGAKSGRGGAGAGTNVSATKKGGMIATFSHAGDRSCRAGSSGAPLRPGVVSGGVSMIAPTKRRITASKTTGSSSVRRGGGSSSKSSGKSSGSTVGRKLGGPSVGSGGGKSVATSTRKSASAGSGRSVGGRKASFGRRATSGAGAGAGASSGGGGGGAGGGAAGKSVGGGGRMPKDREALRAARAAFFESKLGGS